MIAYPGGIDFRLYERDQPVFLVIFQPGPHDIPEKRQRYDSNDN